ncbi:hypothetical protein [Sphingosinithalassobacter portus]|uniref:hypothetical protein n=1 Tax=Stakelama portus TaxID=2676234 RepID=UPI000D6E2664|nr:hypothetical protein [Sphingosinithalassobacter portus]
MKKFAIFAAFGAMVSAMPAAAQMHTQDTLYQRVAAWNVYSVRNNGQFWQCSAEATNTNNRMRLIKFASGNSLVIATPSSRRGPFTGGVNFNSQGDGVEYLTTNGWAFFSMPESTFRSHMQQGVRLGLDVGGGYSYYMLSGWHQALGALNSCVANRGRTSRALPAVAVRCASENQLCQFTGWATVQYGATSGTVSRRMRGPVMCSNRSMGSDPAPNVPKYCTIR